MSSLSWVGSGHQSPPRQRRKRVVPEPAPPPPPSPRGLSRVRCPGGRTDPCWAPASEPPPAEVPARGRRRVSSAPPQRCDERRRQRRNVAGVQAETHFNVGLQAFATARADRPKPDAGAVSPAAAQRQPQSRQPPCPDRPLPPEPGPPAEAAQPLPGPPEAPWDTLVAARPAGRRPVRPLSPGGLCAGVPLPLPGEVDAPRGRRAVSAPGRGPPRTRGRRGAPAARAAQAQPCGVGAFVTGGAPPPASAAAAADAPICSAEEPTPPRRFAQQAREALATLLRGSPEQRAEPSAAELALLRLPGGMEVCIAAAVPACGYYGAVDIVNLRVPLTRRPDSAGEAACYLRAAVLNECALAAAEAHGANLLDPPPPADDIAQALALGEVSVHQDGSGWRRLCSAAQLSDGAQCFVTSLWQQAEAEQLPPPRHPRLLRRRRQRLGVCPASRPASECSGLPLLPPGLFRTLSPRRMRQPAAPAEPLWGASGVGLQHALELTASPCPAAHAPPPPARTTPPAARRSPPAPPPPPQSESTAEGSPEPRPPPRRPAGPVIPRWERLREALRADAARGSREARLAGLPLAAAAREEIAQEEARIWRKLGRLMQRVAQGQQTEEEAAPRLNSLRGYLARLDAARQQVIAVEGELRDGLIP